MDGVGIDAVSKISPNRARISLLGIRCTHQFTIFQNRIFAFQHLNHDGTRNHEIHQILEERTLFVHGVELLGLTAREMRHTGSHNAQTSCLKTCVDLTNDVLGNCVGLDDGEGAFSRHS